MSAINDQRNLIEDNLVDGRWTASLEVIFRRAERALALQAGLFRNLDTDPKGRLVRSVVNIRKAERIMDRFDREVRKWIVRPGIQWADGAEGGLGFVQAMVDAGSAMAFTNLDLDLVSQDLLDAVFERVPRGIPAALQVGRDRVHRIMGVVGDDVQTWFRNELLDAVVEGVPIQGTGDSLANRLISSGRLRPIVIRTDKGRIVRKSVASRANGIARVESAFQINAAHEAIGRRALGDDAVWKNSNPRDTRTTPICSQASRQPAMTLDEWTRSRFGRPPRLTPFHWCRSFLIATRPEWEQEQ